MGKRIISRRRGRASPTYTSPSHKHGAPMTHPKVRTMGGTVEDILHNPGHSAPMARVRLDNNTLTHIIAPDGLAVKARVHIGEGEPTLGSVLPLYKIPEGTLVHNIEAKPGDGGKFARAAGNKATVTTVSATGVVVQLPSGRFKEFQPHCRASIGTVAGGGQLEKPLAKAGKTFHKIRSKATYWPIVRSVAKNPVDHPFGGGQKQHPGKPKTVGASAPPGRKVGSIRAKRTGKR